MVGSVDVVSGAYLMEVISPIRKKVLCLEVLLHHRLEEDDLDQFSLSSKEIFRFVHQYLALCASAYGFLTMYYNIRYYHRCITVTEE